MKREHKRKYQLPPLHKILVVVNVLLAALFLLLVIKVSGIQDYLDDIREQALTISARYDAVRSVFKSGLVERCKAGAEPQRLECWRKHILSILQKSGVDAALTQVGESYVSDPAFAKECHSFAHIIGEETYRLFASRKDIGISSKISYCAYGVYHGFMEALLQDGGDLGRARSFCSHVSGELWESLQSIYSVDNACYHGIGHGVVDGSDPRARGDSQSIAQPGLELCSQVADTEDHIKSCATGVFNSLALMHINREHGLSPNAENPYGICEPYVDAHYRRACYEQMNTLILHVAGGDFKKALGFAASLPEEDVYFAMLSLAANFAKALLDDPSVSDKAFLYICGELSQHLRQACIQGLVGGLMEHGQPGSAHIRAKIFCESGGLMEVDRSGCIKVIISNARTLYSPEKAYKICLSMKSQNCAKSG